MSITCDRCGRIMNDWREIEGTPGVGGNCVECGDDLCAKCAGKWSEYGECECRSMSLEGLECALPCRIPRGKE